jgi:16S rRNA (guanine966-N2)-methyltransferase
MRITAGRLRGRKVTVPDIPGVRPTPSKARQAMFNILGSVDGFSVLDLFSGSGLMALESLSRGAESVVSIEKDRRVVERLQTIRRDWELAADWKVMCGDVQTALTHLQGQRFDLIFADPPYSKGISDLLPVWLDAAGVSCDQLIIEEETRATPVWPAGWTERQVRRYGGTCLHFLDKEGA